MQHRRGLIVSNMVALALLLVIFLIAWREAVAVGLAVLILLNLMVLIRGQSARSRDDWEE